MVDIMNKLYLDLYENLEEYDAIPERTLNDIRKYVEKHEPVGHFLTGIFKNDLFITCVFVDDINKPVLWLIVKFVFNRCPPKCWGTPEKVEAWLNA